MLRGMCASSRYTQGRSAARSQNYGWFAGGWVYVYVSIAI